VDDRLRPRDANEAAEAVAWALASGKTLEIVGSGSKREMGRSAQWDLTLDMSAFSGVTLYEPEELVLSAKAGTPVSEIETLVASRGQSLAFEPMDYGPLLGQISGQGTLGGVLATNLSGPRRIQGGAARDHFLGFTAVSGRGEIFKSGGRVVKNVTGYDLAKLMAGSWGTLAAMTEVTIKVLPRAETEQTLFVFGLDDVSAAKAMAAAMASSAEVSGAAHLPAAIAARVAGPAGKGSAVTALRLEGVAASIAQRKQTLEGVLQPFGALLGVGEAGSRALWQALREVAPFVAADGEPARPVWRISAAPLDGPQIAGRITASAQAEVFYDWAGGLVWVCVAAPDDAAAEIVRGAVRSLGGHATLVRAPRSLRAAIDVFEPQSGALAALTRRIKVSFDPNRILGPGRMYAGV
jgi:glycolate dehydrogenase FAD-binding subunit